MELMSNVNTNNCAVVTCRSELSHLNFFQVVQTQTTAVYCRILPIIYTTTILACLTAFFRYFIHKP